MTLPKAAELVLNYINANRKARASYPDADLPIEEAMRMLAEHALKETTTAARRAGL